MKGKLLSILASMTIIYNYYFNCQYRDSKHRALSRCDQYGPHRGSGGIH